MASLFRTNLFQRDDTITSRRHAFRIDELIMRCDVTLSELEHVASHNDLILDSIPDVVCEPFRLFAERFLLFGRLGFHYGCHGGLIAEGLSFVVLGSVSRSLLMQSSGRTVPSYIAHLRIARQ